MKNTEIQRFAALYTGLHRARGIWHPDTKRMETTREAPTIDHFTLHLKGELGLGVVPIKEEATCMWGAIDIDAHDDGDSIDLAPLSLKIEEFGLPLIVCSSKSQGAHLYLYLNEETPASLVQGTLKRWAAALGHGGVEIFPKQTRLAATQVGNWINLPYFDADDTVRFAYNSGKHLSLADFLDLAESKRVSGAALRAFDVPEDLEDAPPCVQHLLTQGIDTGDRNNALFALATFFKKRGDSDIEEQLLKVNYDKDVLSKPLPKREIVTIANSISRGTYNYRCNEPPISNHCDRDTCIMRKYGVTEGPTKVYNEVMWGSLAKVKSDPPRWVLEVNEIPIELTTEELMEFRNLRKKVMESADLVIPPLKQEDWLVALRQRMENKMDIEAPEDAASGALTLAMLEEFIYAAVRFDDDDKPLMGDRGDLLRGRPVLTPYPGSPDQLAVIFRGPDFIQYLKRKKAEEMKGAALWSVLRKAGCTHQKVRVGRTVRSLWLKQVDPEPVTLEIPDMKSEF